MKFVVAGDSYVTVGTGTNLKYVVYNEDALALSYVWYNYDDSCGSGHYLQFFFKNISEDFEVNSFKIDGVEYESAGLSIDTYDNSIYLNFEPFTTGQHTLEINGQTYNFNYTDVIEKLEFDTTNYEFDDSDPTKIKLGIANDFPYYYDYEQRQGKLEAKRSKFWNTNIQSVWSNLTEDMDGVEIRINGGPWIDRPKYNDSSYFQYEYCDVEISYNNWQEGSNTIEIRGYVDYGMSKHYTKTATTYYFYTVNTNLPSLVIEDAAFDPSSNGLDFYMYLDGDEDSVYREKSYTFNIYVNDNLINTYTSTYDSLWPNEYDKYEYSDGDSDHYAAIYKAKKATIKVELTFEDGKKITAIDNTISVPDILDGITTELEAGDNGDGSYYFSLYLYHDDNLDCYISGPCNYDVYVDDVKVYTSDDTDYFETSLWVNNDDMSTAPLTPGDHNLYIVYHTGNGDITSDTVTFTIAEY